MICKPTKWGKVGSKDFLPRKSEFALQHLKAKNEASPNDRMHSGLSGVMGLTLALPLQPFLAISVSLQHRLLGRTVLFGDKTLSYQL